VIEPDFSKDIRKIYQIFTRLYFDSISTRTYEYR